MVSVKTFFFKHWAWIFLALAIFISFSLAAHAQAAVLEQLDKSTYSGATDTLWQDLNTNTIDLTGQTASSITFHADPGSCNQYRVNLNYNGTNVRQSSILSFPSTGDHTYTFSPYTFPGNAQAFIYVSFSLNNFGCAGTLVGGSATNKYPYGAGSYMSGLADAYFITDIPAPPSNDISITTPANGSTVSSLGFWGISYTSASSTTYVPYVNPFYTIEVTAGNTSSTFEGTLVGLQDLSSTSAGVSATSSPSAVQAFIPGITYYAQATLLYHPTWGSSGNLVASSSVISFTVSTTTVPGTFGPGTGSTSTISGVNVCDPDSFFLLYGLCRLFVPQASDFYIFDIMRSYVEHKPPFGYIGLTVSALQNLESGSSTISFPDLTNFHLVLDPLRSGINNLIWLTFVFWLFYKYRNVEL